jgi:hypothetical protein
VVDVGWALVNRNELQNISDGASLAATRELGHMYQQVAPPDQAAFTCYGTCAERIREVATAVAAKNQAGNVGISLLEADIRIGQWEDGTFTETGDQPDAVEVTSRRDESANTAVPTFFARIMGIDETPVVAIATAALTGQGTSGEGELLFPVTLSEWFFEAEDDRCNDYIVFHPANDPESCGGWTTWDDKSNANLLRKILDGDNVSPEMTANDDRIWTIGGDLGTAFPHMLMLFQRQGCASTNEPNPINRTFLIDDQPNDDPGFPWITYPDCVTWEEARDEPGKLYNAVDKAGQYAPEPWMEDGVQAFYPKPNQPTQPDPTAPRYYHMWETGVPVYSYEDAGVQDPCANPSSRVKWLVVGFAPVIITDVIEAPDKRIVGRVVCNRYSPYDTRGGGGDFGLKGSIPGLVR